MNKNSWIILIVLILLNVISLESFFLFALSKKESSLQVTHTKNVDLTSNATPFRQYFPDSPDRYYDNLPLNVYLASGSKLFSSGAISSTAIGYNIDPIVINNKKLKVRLGNTETTNETLSYEVFPEQISFVDSSKNIVNYSDIKKGDRLKITQIYNYKIDHEDDSYFVEVIKLDK